MALKPSDYWILGLATLAGLVFFGGKANASESPMLDLTPTGPLPPTGSAPRTGTPSATDATQAANAEIQKDLNYVLECIDAGRVNLRLPPRGKLPGCATAAPAYLVPDGKIGACSRAALTYVVNTLVDADFVSNGYFHLPAGFGKTDAAGLRATSDYLSRARRANMLQSVSSVNKLGQASFDAADS
jgi:hypothetical protein